MMEVGIIVCPDCGKSLRLFITGQDSKYYMYGEVCSCQEEKIRRFRERVKGDLR